MDKLRMMPDSELFQFAQMHKSDPYIFPLTFQESNARKAMRSAQQMSGMQAPKVVDQDLQKMAPARPMAPVGMGAPQQAPAQAPQQPQQALPEDQGIGQLPAQNMQNMAGGGIVAFADGGDTSGGIDYRQYAIQRARQLGLNPNLVDNIFNYESGYNPIAKSGTGPVGIGQISKFIARSIFGQRNGIDPSSVGKANDGRLDPIKNINTSLDFMAHLNQKYKGDPTKVAVAYNQGEPVLDKHLRENDGKVVPQDLPSEARKYISKTLTNLMPFGSANAEEVPRQVATAAPATQAAPQTQGIAAINPAISQIPGQSVKAPAAKDENTYFGGIADAMGIPQEYQRNISNTLNALGGYTAPVAGAGRVAQAGAAVAKELEPTAAMAQRAAQAAQVANTPRILPPAKAGLEALDEASAATRAAAENSRRMAQLEADRQAAIGAGQSVEAATQTANVANKTAQEIAAAQDVARLNQAKMTGAAQGLAGMQAIDKATGLSDLTATQPEPAVSSYEDLTRMQNRPVSEPTSDETPIAEAAPAETKKDGMDWNDMMIKMGLGLMAGKSPNAITNIGEAGMGALQMSMAEKKAQAEQAKMQAETELYKSHGAYYGQLAGLKGEQIDSRTAIAAEQIIANQMKAINANMLLTQAQKTQKEAEIRASVYSQLRPSAMAATPNVGVGLPEGVTVKQVG
jgi:hypothetical protein